MRGRSAPATGSRRTAVLRGSRESDRRRRRHPIVGPAQEKDFSAKYLAEKHPAIRTHVEGVEKADHPTDGELLDFARRYVKAADHMRPQIDPREAGKP